MGPEKARKQRATATRIKGKRNGELAHRSVRTQRR
jgi:hypothetical protein